MARPTKHGETKAKKSVYVTDDAWENFDRIANQFMISRSELVEMIGQERLRVIHNAESQARTAPAPTTANAA